MLIYERIKLRHEIRLAFVSERVTTISHSEKARKVAFNIIKDIISKLDAIYNKNGLLGKLICFIDKNRYQKLQKALQSVSTPFQKIKHENISTPIIAIEKKQEPEAIIEEAPTVVDEPKIEIQEQVIVEEPRFSDEEMQR